MTRAKAAIRTCTGAGVGLNAAYPVRRYIINDIGNTIRGYTGKHDD